MVKKDQEKAQTDKSGKLVTNGSTMNKNSDPVGAVEPSSSVSS